MLNYLSYGITNSANVGRFCSNKSYLDNNIKTGTVSAGWIYGKIEYLDSEVLISGELQLLHNFLGIVDVCNNLAGLCTLRH
jgi:hypothetical protein